MPPKIVKQFAKLKTLHNNFKEAQSQNVTTMDIPFRLSGKYSPIVLAILMCLSFGNQFFRHLEIDCTSPQLSKVLKTIGNAVPNSRMRTESDFNDFCWKEGTFLVEKALEPNWRKNVSIPGISSYIKGKDGLLSQNYYKGILLGLGITELVSLLPLILWKLKRSVPKLIRSVTLIGKKFKNKNESGDKAERRVEAFIQNIGVNKGSAFWYFICKTLAFASTMFPWFYFSGLIGKGFKTYGVDVFSYLFSRDNWPNPMDVVFPKAGKCQWTQQEGSSEELYGLCQLPMNEITQWSFFVFWWWIVIVFSVNLTHFLYFISFLFPSWRNYSFRDFVTTICQNDDELAKYFPLPPSTDKKTSQVQNTDDVLHVSLSDEDWFLLNSMEQNLPVKEFESFIKKLVVTPNPVVQLKDLDEPFDNASRRRSLEEEITDSENQIELV